MRNIPISSQDLFVADGFLTHVNDLEEKEGCCSYSVPHEAETPWSRQDKKEVVWW